MKKPANNSTKKIKPREINTWRQAAALKLYRESYMFNQMEALDPGVNFFVLMLEKLGAKTAFSCEGHPNNFYVTFFAPMSVAHSILRCGFFSVELEGSNYWSIRINRSINEQERIKVLTWAAEAWKKEFGPITYAAKDNRGNNRTNSKSSGRARRTSGARSNRSRRVLAK